MAFCYALKTTCHKREPPQPFFVALVYEVRTALAWQIFYGYKKWLLFKSRPTPFPFPMILRFLYRLGVGTHKQHIFVSAALL